MTDDKKQQLEGCLRMTEALLDAMESAVRDTGADDLWRFSSYKTYMRKYNDVLTRAVNIDQAIDAPVDLFKMDAVPDFGNTTIPHQRNLFELARANLQILKAYLANRVDPKERQVVGIADFLQANLRRAMIDRPEREKEVQNTLEQLFIGRGMEKGIDYDREVGRVKVSSKEVIPDFVLPPLDTAIEVKLLRDKGALGNVIDEINSDIQSYSREYAKLVFVVYDLGALRDENEFRRDLESTDNVKVVVVKH